MSINNPYPEPGDRVQGIWDQAPHGVLIRTQYIHSRGLTVADVNWDSGSQSRNIDLEMIEKEPTT